MDNYEELLEMINEISCRYSVLTDTDELEAFSIMRDSSILQSNFEEMLADCYKLAADKERMAKATEARRRCELSDKPTNGNRMAAFDPEVIRAWKEYSESIKQTKYVEANAKLLSRIYFDCKMIYEACVRRMSKPQDKIVGRV